MNPRFSFRSRILVVLPEKSTLHIYCFERSYISTSLLASFCLWFYNTGFSFYQGWEFRRNSMSRLFCHGIEMSPRFCLKISIWSLFAFRKKCLMGPSACFSFLVYSNFKCFPTYDARSCLPYSQLFWRHKNMTQKSRNCLACLYRDRPKFYDWFPVVLE